MRSGVRAEQLRRRTAPVRPRSAMIGRRPRTPDVTAFRRT
ncbi:hypothetical protein N599_21960 [Saccharopolyspora erythraea D]|nr:hypothetical protein N599_21960 [Saccharopolyspora erythraea D]